MLTITVYAPQSTFIQDRVTFRETDPDVYNESLAARVDIIDTYRLGLRILRAQRRDVDKLKIPAWCVTCQLAHGSLDYCDRGKPGSLHA